MRSEAASRATTVCYNNVLVHLVARVGLQKGDYTRVFAGIF